MIPQQSAQAVLARALSTGGDFAELFVEDTFSSTLSLQSGKIEQAVSGRESGAGVRVFMGTRSVYAYTNDLSLPGLLETAQKAAAAIGTFGKDVPIRLAYHAAPNAHPVQLVPHTVAMTRKAECLKAACFAAKDYDPLISQVTGRLLEEEQHVDIFNSEGVAVGDTRTRVRLSVSAIASNGTENQTGSRSPGAQMGFEFIEGLDLAKLGRESAQVAVRMLKAPYCKAGVMPVVIENGFGGVLFHEACGHSLEATSVSRGTSQFTGKLGCQIAAPIVNAVDDGTIPHAWGSINVDDEGAPSQRNQLIKDGVLTGYMIDKLGGRRMGMAPTGSGRRQGYQFAPTSRMTNTFICPGTDDDEEMISTMGDGLYAAQMGGGSVNPATGEFNFAVLEGYLVKDGKIVHPLRGASLIGKGSDVLMKIDRIGKNLECGQGMCGSSSGSIPTNVGQPRIRISSLTVGGR